MTAKEFTAAAKTALLATHGAAFDAEMFAKALAKAKRHMTAKYGCLDYAAEFSESGAGNVDFFYSETVEQKDGAVTFNRNRAQNRR